MGTAYGAFGSFASVVTPAFVVSEIEEVKGTDPVKSTIIMPSVKRVRPRDREKYSSRTDVLLACHITIGGTLTYE